MTQASLDALDAQLRAEVRAEPRVMAALAYGSRTRRPGVIRHDDEHSDLEYYVYLHPGAHLGADELVEQATPVVLAVVNPFGTPNFVTPELHRIELHVAELDRLPDILGWPSSASDPAQMLVKDAGGMLALLLSRLSARPDWAPEAAQTTFDQLLNGLVAVRGFLARGERLRAYEELTSWGVVGNLIRLARHAEAADQPRAATRRAEHDLSASIRDELNAVAVGVADLEVGYAAALRLAEALAYGLGLDARSELLKALRQAY